MPRCGFWRHYDWVGTWSQSGIKQNITLTELYSKAARNLSSVGVQDGGQATTLSQSIVELNGLFWIQSFPVGEINKMEQPQFFSKDSPICAPFVQMQCATFDYNTEVANSRRSPSNVTFPVDMLYDYSRTSNLSLIP